MNLTKIEFRFRQGIIILAVLFSALVVLGVTNLMAATPSDERMETTPLPLGKEMALTGEVVMIEGNVEFVDDPAGGKRGVPHHGKSICRSCGGRFSST
jgi:hypothetical protein